jgi:L-malate glycosyltransferase
MRTAPDVTRPRHVLQLTLAFRRGGRRDAIVTLADQLHRHGVTTSLVALEGTTDDVADFAGSFAHHEILGTRGLPSVQQLLTLRRWCRTWGVDLVHAHDAASQVVATELRCVAPKLHSLMTFHRSLGFESAGWRNRVRNGLTLLAIDRVTTASEERRQHFLHENWISPAKVEVLPLGVDTSRFRPDPGARTELRSRLGLSPDTILVLSLGHFGDEKGVDRAIAAVGMARARLPEGRVALAVLGTGDPSRGAHLGEVTKAAGFGPEVFHGQRADPERWLAAADLLIHAPRIEAFGLALVQAMTTGVVPIATAVGGIPALVTHGETGWLARQDPPIEELAEGVAQLASDRALRERLAEAGQALVAARFTAEAFGARYLDLYRRLLRR